MSVVRAHCTIDERNGTNPLEQRALYRIQTEIASLPASEVVQMAMWPERLADWATSNGIKPSVVYNMLAGTQANYRKWQPKPYHRVREMLARGPLSAPLDGG
jgi:hypothetical protein